MAGGMTISFNPSAYAPLANPIFTGTLTAAAATFSGQVTSNGTAPVIYVDGTVNGNFRGLSLRNNGTEFMTITGQYTNGEMRYDSGGAVYTGFHAFRCGTAGETTRITSTNVSVASGTAIPAGGTAGVGVVMSSATNFGVFFGSGVPTLSAAKGSLYLRSDGSSTITRAYINTDGATTWTALTTVG